MVSSQKDVSSKQLANRIEQQTHLCAKTSDEFKVDTVRMWFISLADIFGVLITSLTTATISSRPVLKLESSMVFSGW